MAALLTIFTRSAANTRILIDGKPVANIIGRVKYAPDGTEQQRDIILLSGDFKEEIDNA